MLERLEFDFVFPIISVLFYCSFPVWFCCSCLGSSALGLSSGFAGCGMLPLGVLTLSWGVNPKNIQHILE